MTFENMQCPPGLLSRWVLDSLIVTPSDLIIMMINDESQGSCHALLQFFYHKLWHPSLVPFLFSLKFFKFLLCVTAYDACLSSTF